jgi:succinyl-diaminopimelate desuccinylase
MKNKAAILSALLALFSLQCDNSGGTAGVVQVLEESSAKFVAAAAERSGGDGPAAFEYFSEMLVGELTTSGNREAAERVRKALEGQSDSISRSNLAWMVHTFAREFYREKIIEATSKLIQFRTFATGVPNRLNPEFIDQRDFLRELAESLGLGFRDVDGYVQEIWIGEGGEPFGLMVHSDVQPVDPGAWSFDPWSGEIIDDTIRGRGAIDDKGALVAIMYGMRSLLDSGVPLRNRLILLVGTDEESANEDVTTYLQTNEPPSKTIVVDYAYPLFCAEKGWCGVWMKAALGDHPSNGDIVLADLQSGFSPSIVPGTAVATFVSRGISPDSLEQKLNSLADQFMVERDGSNLQIERKDSAVIVTAKGRSVHSSVPETGHNALMDMLVWSDGYVKPAETNLALMARFAATHIGFELDGRSLGIAHTDSFMGDVSVAGNMFQTDTDSILFMFNFRIPKGMDLGATRQTIEKNMHDFTATWKIGFSHQAYYSEPFYRDPDDPFINRLLGVYNEVTGEAAGAHSMGGGTYARRIPNAVVFGPSLHDDEYRGHQPNEYITLEALTRNIEILTHTLVVFGME